MGFLPEPSSKEDAVVIELANRLFDGLLKIGRVKKGVTRASIKRMISLQAKYGTQVVSSVLDWFLAHTDKFPTVKSGIHFQHVFDQIKRAMENDEEGVVVTQETLVRAKAILNQYTFPVEIGSRMPAIFQVTKKRWDGFYDLLIEYCKTCPARERGFLTSILVNHAVIFPWEWVRILHVKYGTFQNYHGQTSKLFFYPENPLFLESFWHMWSSEWCTNPIEFDGLLNTLKEKK